MHTRYNVPALYESDEWQYNFFNPLYNSDILYNEDGVPYGGAHGTYAGQTLVWQLNRLANGGFPRPTAQLVDVAKAANQYAGTSNMDVVGALNMKAGNQRGRWLDLAGVCNQIAGTFALDPSDALGQVPE
jgi:hypothetical protein